MGVLHPRYSLFHLHDSTFHLHELGLPLAKSGRLSGSNGAASESQNDDKRIVLISLYFSAGTFSRNCSTLRLQDSTFHLRCASFRTYRNILAELSSPVPLRPTLLY